MHTSQILEEALKKYTRRDIELTTVLFAIAVERLMKQHLYEVDSVLILDKSNDTQHIVKFRRLYSKVQDEDFNQKIDSLYEKRENFKTITFNDFIRRHDEIFNEKLIEKLQRLEQRLSKKQEYSLNNKINEQRREYHEMSEEDIEANKQLNIRDSYYDRAIIKEQIQCPACENSTFHILKIYDEGNEENGEFITKGVCLICGLELTEEEMKSLHLR